MSDFDTEVTPFVDQVSDPDPDLNGSEPQSITERLRQQRRDSAENKFHDFDIPGFNGELFCRYRLIDGKELDAVGVKIRTEFRNRGDRVFYSTCDNLILACEEFWVRDGGKEIPLREVEEYTGPRDIPIRYDQNLAEALDFTSELSDPPTARSVVLALFGGNDLAVTAHGARVVQWMMKAGTEVDMLLGEA